MSDLIYEVQEGVGVVTLNSPSTLNALTGEMISLWAECLEQARLDPTVRTVVVTGAGRGFCSGMNVKARAHEQSSGRDQHGALDSYGHLRNGVHRVARAVRALDKPYIAAVNGPAAGAGMDMASMADIRFAGESARFVMAYVRVGLIPGDGGCYYLPRIIGMARALDLMWTGRPLVPEEAARMGYVLKVIPDADLLAEAIGYARQLARGPAVAIQQIRRLAYQSQECEHDLALSLAESAMFVVQQTEDAKEGPRAFAERRQPQFQGR